MANKYFINLPEKTIPEDSNILPIEDSQDTKRMTWSNLVKPIKDEANTHKAETASDDVHGLADKVIAESGSNTNGRYIKFSDGTMICFHISDLIDVDVAHGSIFTSDNQRWTFPAAFLSTPSPSALGTGNSFGGDAGLTTTWWTFRLNKAQSAVSRLAYLTAIGRWK